MAKQNSLNQRGLFALALLATLPALLALAIFGIIETPDSPGYIDFATQIRLGTVPRGIALLQEQAEPISLFRIGGFPALLALLQLGIPQGWKLALVILQILAQAGVVVASYLAAMKLGARSSVALLAALAPAIGFAVVLQICILTDSLCDAAITGAALAMILCPNWRGALIAGLLLALAMSFREATCFLVLAYLPLAALLPRRMLCTALLVVPVWSVAAAQITWNASRGAGPVLTTSSQIVMVQAVLPLLRRHLPVYDSNDPFDKIANETVGVGGYANIDALQARAFHEAYMTAPEIAKTATARYAQTWQRFPGPMLIATISNFRMEFLAMPFQPIDTVGALMVYANWPRPNFDRLNILSRELVHGSAIAGFWLALEIISKIIGTSIGLLGLAGPWLRFKNTPGHWQLVALWCVPLGLVGLYLPVHIETRYLAPAVPLICVLASATVTRIVNVKERQKEAKKLY